MEERVLATLADVTAESESLRLKNIALKLSGLLGKFRTELAIKEDNVRVVTARLASIQSEVDACKDADELNAVIDRINSRPIYPTESYK